MNRYYVHNDHLGTPQSVTNDSGQEVWRADYRPFGEPTINADVDGDANTLVMNVRFPGQYYDAESGLHYNYFRDYNPSLGRYIQSDPIGLDGGINTYGYAFQNPIRFFDEDGLRPKPCDPSLGFPPGTTCDDGKDNENLPGRCITAECAAGLPPTNKNSCENKCVLSFAIPVDDVAAAAASSTATGTAKLAIKAVVKRGFLVYNIAAVTECIENCNQCN